MTKAELKRQLVVGRKLILVNCLMGPCNKPRTVKDVKSGNSYVMLTDEGRESHLHITSDEKVIETSNGFQIVVMSQLSTPGMPEQKERIAAEYVWSN